MNIFKSGFKPGGIALPAICLLFLLILAGCGSGQQNANESAAPANAAGNEHIVEIADYAFSPATLEIKKGDSVTFVNKDSVAHTATADGGIFDTGLLDQDASQNIVFANAGEFSYKCTPHPNMKGSIIVSE